MAIKKSEKVFWIIDIIVISVVVLAIMFFGISIFIKRNIEPKIYIEKGLEEKYNRDFEIINIKRKKSEDRKATFWAKFHYIATVKDKKTGVVFEAKKEEDRDKVLDKYMSDTFK